ncbi:MAG TPA: UrcA family protein [Steroidobacteraceae bacterium]|nr:UrcA family protein [Steroidobacteraceae bacterium]
MNTIIQNTARAAAFLLCGAIALCTQAATARTSGDAALTQRVSYADLDISKPAGAKVLYGRIVAAARHVCALDGSRDLGSMQWVNKCTDLAIDKAVQDVGSPALSALRPNTVIHFASN